MKNNLKTILTIFVFALFLSACVDKKPDYKYSWKLLVTYTDDTKYVIDYSIDSFNGNEAYLTLSTSAGTCLISSCGFYDKAICCGVRCFSVLEFKKIPIDATK